jgi:NADPH2:quinone reductase
MQSLLTKLASPASASLRAGVRRGLRSSAPVCAVPDTMKAVVVHETGPASVLTLESAWPAPTPKAGEVIVKNDFAGLNFIDTYHRGGLYPRDLPFIGGQEGAGVVSAVTPEAAAAGIKEGDRVAYSVLGTYSEYVAVPAAKVLPVPDAVPLDVATSLVVQGMTAHYLTTSAHADLIKARNLNFEASKY